MVYVTIKQQRGGWRWTVTLRGRFRLSMQGTEESRDAASKRVALVLAWAEQVGA